LLIQIELLKPENQARDWRYQSFATILNNSHYDLLLTGHTLSDCAETILFIYVGVRFRGVSLKVSNFRISLPPVQNQRQLKFNLKSTHLSFSFADLQYKKSTNVNLETTPYSKGPFGSPPWSSLAFAPPSPFPWDKASWNFKSPQFNLNQSIRTGNFFLLAI
jgi:hypothetical protein